MGNNRIGTNFPSVAFQDTIKLNAKYPVIISIHSELYLDSIEEVVKKILTNKGFNCINQKKFEELLASNEKELLKRIDLDKAGDPNYIRDIRRKGPIIAQTIQIDLDINLQSNNEVKINSLSYRVFTYPNKNGKPIPLNQAQPESLNFHYEVVISNLLSLLSDAH